MPVLAGERDGLDGLRYGDREQPGSRNIDNSDVRGHLAVGELVQACAQPVDITNGTDEITVRAVDTDDDDTASSRVAEASCLCCELFGDGLAARLARQNARLFAAACFLFEINRLGLKGAWIRGSRGECPQNPLNLGVVRWCREKSKSLGPPCTRAYLFQLTSINLISGSLGIFLLLKKKPAEWGVEASLVGGVRPGRGSIV